MLQRLIVLAALLLGGCATPAITAAGGGNVTVRYDSILYTRDEITARAAEQCRTLDAASTGARFLSSSTEGPLFGFRYDVFACMRRGGRQQIEGGCGEPPPREGAAPRDRDR